MKKYSKLIVLPLTLFCQFSDLSAEERPTNSVELISKLKTTDDDEVFGRCNAAIKLDSTISEQTRLELRIKYLILAQRYLKNRSIPAGKSVSNPPRPDGGVSGADPSVIKDPVLRAQYIKTLADNEALSKSQNKYRLLIHNRYEITKYLSGNIVSKFASPEAIASLLYQNTTTTDEAKELMSFIDQAAVAANQEPVPWPDVPKEK